jgi:hypothetical protein
MILDIILYLALRQIHLTFSMDCKFYLLKMGPLVLWTLKGTGTPYYLWNQRSREKHNFDEACFVHPKMKTKELEKFKLNIFPLTVPSSKGL